MSIPLPAMDVSIPSAAETVNNFSKLIGLHMAVQQQADAQTQFNENQEDQTRFQAAVRDGNGDPVATGKLMLKYGVPPKDLMTYSNYLNGLSVTAQQLKAGQLAIGKQLNDAANGGMATIMKIAPGSQREAAYQAWIKNPQTQAWAKAAGVLLPATSPDNNWLQMHTSLNTTGSTLAAAALTKKKLAIQQQQANTAQTSANKPTEASLAYQAAGNGPQATQAQGALDKLQQERAAVASLTSVQLQEMHSWLKANPGKTPADFLAYTKTLVPGYTFNLQNAPSPNVDQMARGIASYQLAPLSGYVLSRPEGQAIMARVMELNPKYNSQGYAVSHDFMTGPDGRNIGNLNTAVKHLNALDAAGHALNNGQLKAGNAVYNAISSELGGTPPDTFQAIKSAVASELASALKGNATDAEIAAANKAINAAQSPKQLHAVVNEYLNVIHQKLGTYQERFNQATGGRSFGWSPILPGAQAIFNARGIGQATAKNPAVTLQPGTIEDGYRFKGGNPADKNSWEKVGQ